MADIITERSPPEGIAAILGVNDRHSFNFFGDDRNLSITMGINNNNKIRQLTEAFGNNLNDHYHGRLITGIDITFRLAQASAISVNGLSPEEAAKLITSYNIMRTSNELEDKNKAAKIFTDIITHRQQDDWYSYGLDLDDIQVSNTDRAHIKFHLDTNRNDKDALEQTFLTDNEQAHHNFLSAQDMEDFLLHDPQADFTTLANEVNERYLNNQHFEENVINETANNFGEFDPDPQREFSDDYDYGDNGDYNQELGQGRKRARTLDHLFDATHRMLTSLASYDAVERAKDGQGRMEQVRNRLRNYNIQNGWR